ncbi:hypothetical protein D3C71_1408670 [compost metagenome]
MHAGRRLPGHLDAGRDSGTSRFVQFGHEALALRVAIRKLGHTKHQPGDLVLMRIRQRVVQAVLGLQGGIDEAHGESQRQCRGDTRDLTARAHPAGPGESARGSHQPQYGRAGQGRQDLHQPRARHQRKTERSTRDVPLPKWESVGRNRIAQALK